MTREEAIKRIRDFMGWFKKNKPLYEALEMAIQALSQEPCDDAISREWLKTAIHNFYYGLKHTPTEEDIQAYIDVAPSVTQKSIECEDAISRDAVFNAIEREDKWLLSAKGHNGLTEIAFSGLKARIDALPSVNTTKNIVNHGTMNITL